MPEFLQSIDIRWGQVWPYLYVALEVAAVMLAIDAVMKQRTSQGAVAWAMGLIFMPLLVIPFYLLVGQRRFYGYVEARRKGDLEIQKIASDLLKEMHQSFQPEEITQGGFALEKLARMPFTKGNQIELLVNGDHTFQALFDAIDRATDYILVQFYIIRHDRIGWAFQEKLSAKAAAGVKVYFMFDSIGSFNLSRRYVRKLKRSGVEVIPFRTKPINFRGRYQINFRNHRKIVVVDGKEAFVGGLNVGDEYLGHHNRLSPWRDTHLSVRGPAVQGVQLSFLEDWYWGTSEVPDLNWQPSASEQNQPVLVMPTGPADQVETCQLMFLHAINSATSRLWIVSPYFVPDDPIIKAIKLAAYRGVDVRILIPGKTDNRVVLLSGLAHVMDTDTESVRFYRYQKGFLHQKVVLVDDRRTYIGTANLDNRSFRLNFELTVVIRGRLFASKVEAMLEKDFNHSVEISRKSLLQRSRIFHIVARVARLFSPLQ